MTALALFTLLTEGAPEGGSLPSSFIPYIVGTSGVILFFILRRGRK